MKELTVSQVAKAANVHIETIRYYEKRGLIPKPLRTESGYRKFSQETVEDIRIIKRAQEIGFTLEEIRNLLTIYKDDEYIPTEDMYKFATEKVKEIEVKIQKLNNFKTLLELVTKRTNTEIPVQRNQCPIIKRLTKGNE